MTIMLEEGKIALSKKEENFLKYIRKQQFLFLEVI